MTQTLEDTTTTTENIELRTTLIREGTLFTPNDYSNELFVHQPLSETYFEDLANQARKKGIMPGKIHLLFTISGKYGGEKIHKTGTLTETNLQESPLRISIGNSLPLPWLGAAAQRVGYKEGDKIKYKVEVSNNPLEDHHNQY